MPFTKVGENKYKSPSGRTFNTAQVKLYHAHDGFPKQHKSEVMSSLKNRLKKK